MLNVSTHPSLAPNSTLTNDINASGACFVGCTAIPHASAPTVRYYSLTPSDRDPQYSWLSAVPGLVYSASVWLRDVIPHTTFMFPQGWLTAAAFHRPVLAFPIVTAICASCLHYFNLTLFDAFWGAMTMDGHGVAYARQLIQVVTGEPTTNAVVSIVLVYLVALCGLSSACGMAFLVWRRFLFSVSMIINILSHQPDALLKSVLSPAAQHFSTSSLDSPVLDLVTLPNAVRGDSDLRLDPVPDLAVSTDAAKPGITFSPDTSFDEATARPAWTKPIKPWGTAYRDGELAQEEEEDINDETMWPSESLPPGISTFNFTTMDAGMRRIISVGDDWEADYLADPCVDLELYQPCAPNIHPVDDWWSSDVPEISADLIPFVRECMTQREVAPICDFGVWFQESLGRLRTEGTDKTTQQAASAQIMWTERHPRSAGRVWGQTV